MKRFIFMVLLFSGIASAAAPTLTQLQAAYAAIQARITAQPYDSAAQLAGMQQQAANLQASIAAMPSPTPSASP